MPVLSTVPLGHHGIIMTSKNHPTIQTMTIYNEILEIFSKLTAVDVLKLALKYILTTLFTLSVTF